MSAAPDLLQLVRASRKLMPKTRDHYTRYIAAFLSYANGRGKWSAPLVEEWVQQLLETRSAQSVNKYLSAVKWASKRAAAMHGIVDFAAPIEALRETAAVRPQRALSLEEAQKLVATCDGRGFADARDRAILLLGLRAGLRRHEIAAARWSKLDGATLNIIGKGGHAEQAQLDAETLRALKAWAAAAPPFGGPEDPMFLRQRARLDGKPPALTYAGVYEIILRRARQAGIADMSPHTLRHTFITLLLQAGVPPWRVQLAARHRGRLEGQGLHPTTQNYAHDNRPVGELLPTFGGEP